jgi:septum formation protein
VTELVLASGSAIRRQVLEAAGLSFRVVRPPADEEAVKAELRARGLAPPDQALALAEAKALSVSRTARDAYVIGADQMLALGDRVFDKPSSHAEARANLVALRGQAHHLLCAAVVTRGDAVLWRTLERPKLVMRDFSDAFVDDYLARAGEGALASVGAYQLEGLGAQLFDSVEGDYFCVLGVPLLGLLAFLRSRAVIAA